MKTTTNAISALTANMVIVEDRAGEPFGAKLIGIALVDRKYGFGWAGKEALYIPIDGGAARGALAGDAALVLEVRRRYVASIQREEIAARSVCSKEELIALDTELKAHDNLEGAARLASGVQFGA